MLILFLASIQTQRSKAEEGTFLKISSGNCREAYIIPAYNPVQNADLDFYFPHHGRWTPTARDCSQADFAIKEWVGREYMATRFPARQDRSKINSLDLREWPIETIYRQYSDYGCQFVGILVGNRKLIFANFYLWDAALRGDKDFIFLCDGGPASWQIQYDVCAKTCANLFIESYYR